MTGWQTLFLLEMLPQLKSAEHKCCDRQDQTIALSKVGILQTRSTVWRLSPPQTRATSPRTSSSSSSSCRCWWRWWQYSCWPSISTAARPNTPPVRWAPPRCFVTVNCWTTSWTTGRPVPRHLTAPWPRPLLTQPTPCLPPATPSWGHAQHEVFLLPLPPLPSLYPDHFIYWSWKISQYWKVQMSRKEWVWYPIFIRVHEKQR